MKARLTLFLAVLTVAALFPATAAVADDDEPAPVHWRGAECATGALTRATADLEDWTIVLFGSAAQCARHRKPGEFAVATFQPGAGRGVITMSSIRSHRPGGRERRFGVDVGWAPRFGVCLLASPTRRIACGEITIGAGDKVRFRRICPTDPLVSAPVDTAIKEDGEPSCNSCF